MEKLVDLGLVRHIGTSNMTIPKLELVLRDARIRPAVNEMELHPHFQQPELFDFVRAKGIEPIGYCPVGSPGPAGARPDAGRHGGHRRSGDREDRGAAGRASGGGVHQVGSPARADADSASRQAAQLPGESAGRGQRSADRRRDARDRGHRPQLPADQGAGVPVEARTRLGRSVGPERRDRQQ